MSDLNNVRGWVQLPSGEWAQGGGGGVLEGSNDYVPIDLTAARVLPGVELLDVSGRPLSGTSLVLHRTTGTISVCLDVLALVREIEYDAVGHLFAMFTPVDPEVPCDIVSAVGGALLVNVVGTTITITVVPGTTTLANVIAAVAADPAAAALVTVSGDAGTIPVAFAGGTVDLQNPPIELLLGDAFNRTFSRVYGINGAQLGQTATFYVGKV